MKYDRHSFRCFAVSVLLLLLALRFTIGVLHTSAGDKHHHSHQHHVAHHSCDHSYSQAANALNNPLSSEPHDAESCDICQALIKVYQVSSPTPAFEIITANRIACAPSPRPRHISSMWWQFAPGRSPPDLT